jgi:hypothetical protein
MHLDMLMRVIALQDNKNRNTPAARFVDCVLSSKVDI